MALNAHTVRANKMASIISHSIYLLRGMVFLCFFISSHVFLDLGIENKKLFSPLPSQISSITEFLMNYVCFLVMIKSHLSLAADLRIMIIGHTPSHRVMSIFLSVLQPHLFS